MQNFGKIKNVFNNLLVEGIAKKDDSAKKLFKKYIRTIKESEILKTQFLVYNNIETKEESDTILANIFVSENIKLLEKFNQKDIIKENEKLVKLLGGLSKRLDEEHELSELHEAITSLIFTKRTPKTISVLTEGIKKITNHVQKEKSKTVGETIDLPISVLTNIMVEKYNQKYSEVNENDVVVLKALINSNLDEKKKVYSDVVTECIDLIDKLVERENTPREKLLSVKSKLLEDTEVTNENFIEKFIKITELKENLK